MLSRRHTTLMRLLLTACSQPTATHYGSLAPSCMPITAEDALVCRFGRCCAARDASVHVKQQQSFIAAAAPGFEPQGSRDPDRKRSRGSDHLAIFDNLLALQRVAVHSPRARCSQVPLPFILARARLILARTLSLTRARTVCRCCAAAVLTAAAVALAATVAVTAVFSAPSPPPSPTPPSPPPSPTPRAAALATARRRPPRRRPRRRRRRRCNPRCVSRRRPRRRRPHSRPFRPRSQP